MSESFLGNSAIIQALLHTQPIDCESSCSIPSMSDLDDLLADLANDSDNASHHSEAENIEVDEEQEAQGQTNGTSSTDNKVVDGISNVSQLLYSKQMQETLREISEYSGKEQRRILGIIEADPEYKLIVKANDISMEVDEEIRRVVEFIKQRYAARFPDLEKIVLNPLQYAKAVKLIGNQEDLVHLKLNDIVSNSLAMSIAVTATTTDGRLLTEEELVEVERACDMAIELDLAKTTILKYVTSRIEVIAPNVTQIIGPLTAAKIVGQAGGITNLAKLPACNVPSLGKKQGIMNGLSRLGSQAQGFLYFCSLVQSVPEDVRPQAIRQISGKLILAARIDATHAHPDGSTGTVFKDQLVKKLDKLSEPPELKEQRALKAPNDPLKSRRGGKKVRKAKEKLAITEYQRLRNRMAFGQEELEVGFGDESEGLGMLGNRSGTVGSGATSGIRGPQIDKRTRAKLPKSKMRGGQLTGSSALLSNHSSNVDQLRLSHSANGGSSTHGSGFQSSLSFSSVQGIELPALNIESLQKKKETRAGWFTSGTYSQIKKP